MIHLLLTASIQEKVILSQFILVWTIYIHSIFLIPSISYFCTILWSFLVWNIFQIKHTYFNIIIYRNLNAINCWEPEFDGNTGHPGFSNLTMPWKVKEGWHNYVDITFCHRNISRMVCKRQALPIIRMLYSSKFKDSFSHSNHCHSMNLIVFYSGVKLTNKEAIALRWFLYLISLHKQTPA